MLITHEWIESIGGSENVFRELLAAFPDAQAGCLWNTVPTTFDRPVWESPLAHSWLRGRKALSLPLQPKVWRKYPLGTHELVLASSHAFGHHVAAHAVREGRRGLAYVHTPARYLWAPDVEARGRAITARFGSPPLRLLDRRTTDPRVSYAANSAYIRDRIRASWDQDARVIYPPVDVERIRSVARWRETLLGNEARLIEGLPRDAFILGASRLVSYKRLDLAIIIGDALGLPVVIAGAGPDEDLLKHQAADARVPVTFTGPVSDAQLYALYQEASLYVFLATEDFGIMPVEAMAAGTPVLVHAVGGAAESVAVTDGGVVVDAREPGRELAQAARRAMALEGTGFAHRTNAFSRAAFSSQVLEWVRGSKR